MDQTLSLSDPDYLRLTSPITCEVCRTFPAVFVYEIIDDAEKGHCCPRCFLKVIRSMSVGKTENSSDGQA
jgi:hypothetical protein